MVLSLCYVYINGGFKTPLFLQKEKQTHVLHITYNEIQQRIKKMK